MHSTGILYHIRIRENFWVDIPRNGHRVKAFWLFNYLKINKQAFYRRIVIINGQLCYLAGSKVINFFVFQYILVEIHCNYISVSTRGTKSSFVKISFNFGRVSVCAVGWLTGYK
jgi:hypothetical protein